jgi:hypothetical protein
MARLKGRAPYPTVIARRKSTLKRDRHGARFGLLELSGAKTTGLTDETCNWRWDIGNDRLRASRSADHQRIST